MMIFRFSKVLAIKGLAPRVSVVRFLSAKTQADGSSVDEEEMRKFGLLSKSWWIQNGEFEALHRMNKLRVPLIRDTMINYRNLLPPSERAKISTAGLDSSGETSRLFTDEELTREPLLGMKILDIGCGGGILSEPLARLGAQVTGIDSCKENIIALQLRSENELEKTKGNAKHIERLTYINCSVEDLSSVDDNFNYFDAIVMSEVVEHVNNLNDFISNSTRLLKNHGFAFVTTINRTPQSYLMAILAAEYVLNLVARGTHNWDKFITPDELKNSLERNEVFVKFQMGMSYNPLTKTWCWSKDNSVNYAAYAQKFVTNTNAN